MEKHWSLLSIDVREALGYGVSDLKLIGELSSGYAAAGFDGKACERVERGRRVVPAVPIQKLTASEVYGWLSYHETWGAPPKGEGYAFRQSGLTVFLGVKGELRKHQAFRAEWAGYGNWSGSDLGFSSPGAGHPHWQFDFAETLYNIEAQGELEDLRASLREEEVVEEFGGTPSVPVVKDVIRSTQLSRLHFASAAPWWEIRKDSTPAVHENCPKDDAALRRWVVGCCRYVVQELKLL